MEKLVGSPWVCDEKKALANSRVRANRIRVVRFHTLYTIHHQSYFFWDIITYNYVGYLV